MESSLALPGFYPSVEPHHEAGPLSDQSPLQAGTLVSRPDHAASGSKTILRLHDINAIAVPMPWIAKKCFRLMELRCLR